jgi:hypothetical protein
MHLLRGEQMPQPLVRAHSLRGTMEQLTWLRCCTGFEHERADVHTGSATPIFRHSVQSGSPQHEGVGVWAHKLKRESDAVKRQRKVVRAFGCTFLEWIDHRQTDCLLRS